MGKIENTRKLPVSIKIVGLILSESYQKCKLFAEKLRRHYNKKFAEPVSKGYLEMDWVEYLSKLRRDLGGETWAVRKGVVVFLDGEFVGGELELFTRFSVYAVEEPSPERIKSAATQEYLSYLNQNNLLYTYFELSLDGLYMGSLLFELRQDLLPKTSVWFAMICDPHNHLGYSYKHSTIHRVCKRGWFQGGVLGLGSSAGCLEDESFCYKHDRRGVLSFTNNGKDSSRTQFLVTFEPARWMDEHYVAFGRVVEGSDVLRRLENTKCTYEHPDHVIRVDNCGLVGVGYGKNLVTKTRMKGLTVGEPHIHLETFMDLVLQRFEEVLFERLDEEVKRELKADWIGQMLWQKAQPHLMNREPVDDVLDVNDKSSRLFDPAMIIKGMYGLQEIPDRLITELLHEIVNESVSAVDTRDMVFDIVNLIFDNLDLEQGPKDVFSGKSLVSSLVKKVNSIVYGREKLKGTELSTTMSKKELFQKSIYRVASQTPTIRKLLTEYSTHSVSQASYANDRGEEVTPKTSKFKRGLFQKNAQKVASVSTIRKLLTDYQTLSMSQASVFEEEEGDHDLEKMSTEIPLQGSVSAVASHTSTVRNLMSDYKHFSPSSTGPSVAEDNEEKRGSSRESIVGYIWEMLLKSLTKL